MGVTASGVDKGSPAQRAGIGAGHTLHKINGHPVTDVLDYRFYMMDRALTLDLTDASGKPYTCTVRKGEYEELGLLFDSYLIDREQSCKNKCTFCFIDQMPPGMRGSLYFKDDDSRLSFLFGNYITLTNLGDREIRRIIDMHISPVNVSVHTTNPELRVAMMKNPRAGKVLEYLPVLSQAGIVLNAQLVLCPGVNDGPELARSLRDLSALGEHLQSVSCVPVGITKYREGLTPLRLHTKAEAAAVIDLIEAAAAQRLARTGSRTFFASDEFYLRAERPLPHYAYYEDFYQLENGVGMLSLLDHEFSRALELEDSRAARRSVTVATGTAAFPALQGLADRATACFPGLAVRVVAVENRFFGETVTVAGLVCGCDLRDKLRGRDLGDEVLIPASMLRHDGDLFLDDYPVEQLARELGCPVRAVENDGFALLEALLEG